MHITRTDLKVCSPHRRYIESIFNWTGSHRHIHTPHTHTQLQFSYEANGSEGGR
ncbi:hypothetical protein LSH36_384g02023 [Paralvinella palmiformis]|uniref:Uncharacterized protein n=1 Tax=Paralvinella palmiformis TaxID=53620 RepID=A0AAD9MZ73_9ANNE|nr:hypothetical protein LSH36_384g02023 [Paralvinella palmiformis]